MGEAPHSGQCRTGGKNPIGDTAPARPLPAAVQAQLGRGRTSLKDRRGRLAETIAAGEALLPAGRRRSQGGEDPNPEEMPRKKGLLRSRSASGEGRCERRDVVPRSLPIR